MSGGVDSSTTAALLAESGAECVGLSMQLWNQRRRLGPDGEPLESRCCSLDDLYDARRVAEQLGMPFYVVNLEAAFEQAVVAPFVDAYLSGETPIPCVSCNTKLKFAQLVTLARNFGASRVATGHYARVRFDEARDRFVLSRAVHREKDQTYFLFEMTQQQLGFAMFPLGEMSKAEVRDVARRAGLATADKPESQEICFIPDNDYRKFIEDYLDEQGTREARLPSSGDIVDTSGNVLGSHDGTHRFTVGQRKGMGLVAPEPLYVVQIQRATGRVVAGKYDELLGTQLVARDVNWLAIAEPDAPVRCAARIRYRADDAAATVEALPGNRARVVFDAPQRAITPGQAVVFYDGDDVLGGGWIEAR
ncbi:MAG: tRNA 2-thiouridine(34) synthase MnmA [Acidobacteria bacterium]|nr:tRNA 2-thiouridine(34) synthase MnmA [Acidobacteriota bacterium]